MSHQAQDKIPVLSFFTGAGFLDIGFMRAGFELVFHNEYSKVFAKGFECGYKSLTRSSEAPHVTVADIADLKPDAILAAAFNHKGKPPVWGVIGGPPCPDFSVGGKNRGKEGDNGKLSATYMNQIMNLKPTFFLFENVPGLFRTEKHRAFLNDLRAQAEELYTTDIKILNALDYGVPQDRERVFFIGIHKEWLKEHSKEPTPDQYNSKGNWFPYPKPEVENAKKTFIWPDKDPFESEPERPAMSEEQFKLTVSYALRDLYDNDNPVPNQNEHFIAYSDKFGLVPEGDDHKKSFKRLHRYRYAPTSAYGNNEVHLHPWLRRRLTVREALRLQSVPDEYVLPGNDEMSLSDKFKTIGNGVPVNLGEAVARAILEFLTK